MAIREAPGLDLYGSNLGKSVFLPVRANPASQVRLIDFLARVTAPSVFLWEFALLEVITKLSNGHCAGIRWSAIGAEFRDQPHYGAPRSIFIRILLDCADNFLVVKTLAVKSGLRPAKLPDIRAFFAPISLHTSAFHLFLPPPRRPAAQSTHPTPTRPPAPP